jgi:hypothetical protein
METLGAVLARGRERDGAVVETPQRTAPYSYREFCTNAWKAGNLLRHYGVRPDAAVAVVVGPKTPGDTDPGWLGSAPDPLLGLFGGGAAGATVDLTPTSPVDSRAVLAPAAWLDRYEVRPGCSRLAYGGPPEAADVGHFERELWSENPTAPPAEVDPGSATLRVGREEYTHGQLLDAAETVATDHGLGAGDNVGLDAPLTGVGAFVAGVLAPMTVGATIRPGVGRDGGEEVGVEAGATAYVVRSAGTDPTGNSLDPATVDVGSPPG